MTILLAGLILMLAAAPGRCAGSTSALFLRSESTARMFAMGGAAAALDDDAGALYANPAGLGRMKGHGLTLSTWKGVDEKSRYNFLSGIVDAGRYGAFDVTYLGYNSGSEDINELDGTTRSVQLQRDSALGLGWGHKILEGLLSGGVQVKRVSSELADTYDAKATTFDLGLMARTPEGMFSAGAGVQNMVGSLTYVDAGDPLPRVYYGGVAARLPVDGYGQVLLAADVQKPKDESSRDLRAGLEYSKSFFAVRVGGKRVSGDSTYTLGAGLKFKWLGFDYAFAPSGALDQPIHKVTLNLRFGAATAKKDVAAAPATAPVPAPPAATTAAPETMPSPAPAAPPSPAETTAPNP